MIHPIRIEQFFMSTCLDYLPLINHHNLISILHCTQPMSNHDNRFPLPCQCIQRLLYIAFGNRIKRSRCLIENTYLRFLIQSTCYGKPLPLATRQGCTMFTDKSPVVLRQTIYKVLQTTLFRHIYNFLQVRMQVSYRNILCNAAGK